MNEINAARRLRVAAVEKAETEKVSTGCLSSSVKGGLTTAVSVLVLLLHDFTNRPVARREPHTKIAVNVEHVNARDSLSWPQTSPVYSLAVRAAECG